LEWAEPETARLNAFYTGDGIVATESCYEQEA
jgi:hypothetical protein